MTTPRVTVAVGAFYDQWVASATTDAGVVVALAQEDTVWRAIQVLVADLECLGYALPEYGDLL